MNSETSQKAKSLMVQGTSSGAGKSVLATSFCRIFADMGFKTAPFKAQNMSLNSFVSHKGEEIGRAQALQARACRIEADARMNPVLLKPLGNYKSQVIVMGKPLGIMTFRDFMSQKESIWETVLSAYKSLAEEFDLVILEGAGSPAEINLRRHDIVNMRMAHAAKAPVLLTADIDRGGAFAAVAGTMALLDGQDKKRVAGYLLNKFRGDKSLLDDALRIVENKTRRPFLGIIPMIEDLLLPEEDSASFQEKFACNTPGKRLESLDVALVKMPAISNYTDVDALKSEKCIKIRLVRKSEDLGRPDLLLLPGTRNTGKALAWMHSNGLAKAIKTYADNILSGGRGHMAGICGGLQIMGKNIHDPFEVECQGKVTGLGILDINTNFAREKILRQTVGQVSPSLAPGAPVAHGYEIHHGISVADGNAKIVICGTDGQALGWGIENNGECRIWGTYLHGVFDSDDFRKSYLGRIARDCGLDEIIWSGFGQDSEIDRLARITKENIDMDSILKLVLNQGV